MTDRTTARQISMPRSTHLATVAQAAPSDAGVARARDRTMATWARRGARSGAHGMAMLLLAMTAACGDEGERPAGASEPGANAEAGSEAADGGEMNEGEQGGDAGEHAEGGGTQVTLSEAAFATARIAVEQARAEAPEATVGGLSVPGQVEFDPARVALVSPRVAGRIERLLVVLGDRVGTGQPVALLYSPAYLTAQADVQQAKRRRDLLEGTSDAEGATALLSAARRRLLALGATEADVRALEGGAEPKSLLAVRAPFAGSITEAHVLAGAATEPGAPLFTIADLSAVNVAAHVPERVIGGVRVGQAASVQIAARPDAPFVGRITRVSDVVDSTSRTIEALVRVANSGRVLKPGMFATVTLRGASGGAAATTAPTAPATGAAAESGGWVSVLASAVVMDGDGRYVFVQTGPRVFERRAVELAPASAGSGPAGAGGRVIVVSGLRAGESVVVRGAFTLKSELGKAAFGEEEGE